MEDNGDPNMTHSDPHPDNLPEIPADPLLMSGEFIDTNFDKNQTLTEQPSNVPEELTGQPESGQRKGKRRKPETLDASDVYKEQIDWLPENWKVEYRKRNSGASAGHVDKYYVDPVSGTKFRSRKEVFYYLETGKRGKAARKLLMEGSDDICLGSSSSHKQPKPKSRSRKSIPNFDFANVPEKVCWVLMDTTPDSTVAAWKPFIGHELVPESSKQEWTAAFASLSARNRNFGS